MMNDANYPAEQAVPDQLYYVYFLKSLVHPNRIYTGYTETYPTKRLSQHNAGDSPYTSQHKPWRLVTFVTFTNKAKAREFEQYCKQGSGFRWMTSHLLD
jgi:predicted GIY-YIG superfamily endonuclease